MNEYLSQLADIRQALTYAKYDSCISCSGASDDTPALPKSVPWLGPHYSLNSSFHELDGASNNDTRSPLKLGAKRHGSKISSQTSFSVGGGVTTVQPGLEPPSSADRGLRSKVASSFGHTADEGIEYIELLLIYLICDIC